LRSTITIFALVFAVLGLLLGFSATYAPQGGQLHQLATIVKQRIDSSIEVMRTTSTEPSVRSTDSLSLMSTDQMGIPEDADANKRDVAKDILADHGDFASIFFLMPEGDLYVGEPFEQQKQLPRLNYADRDWYQGVVSTKDAYVSSVFMSAAIHKPAIAIAVPVYAAEGSETVSGYWVAIVKLEEIEKSLRQSATDSGSRMILVDHNGIEVADTARDSSADLTELRSFSGLASVEQALSGKSGHLSETIDGAVVDVQYAPVQAFPHTWAIMSIG
jgi:cache domain-containing protein